MNVNSHVQDVLQLTCLWSSWPHFLSSWDSMLVSNTEDDCLQRQIAQKKLKSKIKAWSLSMDMWVEVELQLNVHEALGHIMTCQAGIQSEVCFDRISWKKISAPVNSKILGGILCKCISLGLRLRNGFTSTHSRFITMGKKTRILRWGWSNLRPGQPLSSRLNR